LCRDRLADPTCADTDAEDPSRGTDMPVRSRGSLLAGSILLGLFSLVGAGCHSSAGYPVEENAHSSLRPWGGKTRSTTGGPNDAFAIRPGVAARSPTPASGAVAAAPPVSGNQPVPLQRRVTTPEPDVVSMPGTIIATSGPSLNPTGTVGINPKAPAPASTTSKAAEVKKTTTTRMWQPWKQNSTATSRNTTAHRTSVPPRVPASGTVIAVSGQATEAGTGVTPAIVPLDLSPLPSVGSSSVPARLGQGPAIADPPPANPAVIASSPISEADKRTTAPGNAASGQNKDKPGTRSNRESDDQKKEEAPPPRLVTRPAPPAGAPIAGVPVGMAAHGYGPPPVPRELAKRALSPYIIEPPDVLLVGSSQTLIPDQPLVRSQHIVSMDGYIRLGIYGQVFVAGMTLDQARQAIAQQISKRVTDVKADNLEVDVLAYNSKFYYVITDGGGWGQQVYRLPYTGNETVLDAVAQIGGLPPVSSKKRIWLARATPSCHQPHILPVDWKCVTQCGAADTNYQLFPGDRLFVQSDARIRADGWLIKTLSPVQRILGTTLLGASTVNDIKGNLGGGGFIR
jgi:polysaccharide export outer membrane protein